MKALTLKVLTFALTLCLGACSLANSGAEPRPVPSAEAEATTPAPTATATLAPEAAAWWNDTIFYEVFVRSFQDSDGDGVGDINGLISRLDYLEELGVTGIWLMPVAESPSYHGYDVVDYYTVDEEYGTKEDFLRLIEEAHARDIRVIVDLVLNHTSSEHPWFEEASVNPESTYRDWYVWSDTRPTGNGWHQRGGDYYYGQFWEGMPDLNYANPDVTAEMLDVTRFWLEEMNVDGFRLDAIKFLIESDGQLESTPETHAWLEQFYDFYKDIDPDAYAVAEAWTMTSLAAQYAGDEVDSVFEFDLARAMLQSATRGDKTSVEFALSQSLGEFEPGEFATFLANHDQKRTGSVFFNVEQAKMGATMLLTFPGVPFLYYGEEILLEGDKPDENLRRPMQWEGIEGSGFTTGTPWRDFDENYLGNNVDSQRADPDSLWNHYRALIELRNTHAALRSAEFVPIDSGVKSIFAYLRPGEESTILVLLNLNRQPVNEYALNLEFSPLIADSEMTLLMGAQEIAPPSVNAQGGFTGYLPLEEIPPYSTTIVEFSP